MRVTLAAAALGLGLVMISPAAGQQHPSATVLKVKAGQPTPILTFFYCLDRSRPGGNYGTARNGKITSRLIVGKACGYGDYPITQMMYSPNPGFRGRDELVLIRGDGYAGHRSVLVE